MPAVATPPSPRPRWERVLIGLTLALAVAAIGTRLAVVVWVLDWFALAAQYVLLAAVGVLGVWSVRRAWRWAAVAAVTVALNAALFLPYLGGETRAADGRGDLRLLVYNLYFQNPRLDAAVAEIRSYDADVIFLMEYSDAIQLEIEDAFADYPYRVIEPSRMTMGLALFSRVPITRSVVHRFETRIPIFDVQFDVGGRPVSFVGGHPWPALPQWGQLHRNQMADIARVAAEAKHPLIVAGDFNAAPWSYAVSRLAALAGARDARTGYPLNGTWWPLPWLGLPLDHILISDGLGVTDFEVGALAGSDHTPLIVDLSLAR